jgi:hypothetical protein
MSHTGLSIISPAHERRINDLHSTQRGWAKDLRGNRKGIEEREREEGKGENRNRGER